MNRPAALLLAFLAAACASGPPQPAPLDTRHEACASCRMAISDARFAAQLVSAGEVPRFFDDLGCLASFVKAGRGSADAVAFVADHQTRAWVRADAALYTRAPALETPMGSRVIAHADGGSRDRDPAARGGTAMAPADLFGPGGPPAGSRR
jgi:copper chaperone NosL